MSLVNVIVVGDDESDRFLIRHLCSAHTAVKSCIEFESAEQALFSLEDPIFRQTLGPHPPPAIMLLDLELPGMSGLDLLDGLVTIEPSLEGEIVVVAMLTSSVMPDDLLRLQRSAYGGPHLRKSLTAAALDGLVDMALGSS